MNRRAFLATAAATIAVPLCASAESDPKSVIQRFCDTLIEVMKEGPALGFDGRFEKLAPVIDETFDVAAMAEKAIGRTWQKLDDSKRQAALEVFDRYMVTTYASRFKEYKGQRFEVGESKQAQDDRMIVETKLIRSNGEPIALNYLMDSDQGDWKIVDVYLSGSISEMARMRSDFSSTLMGGGIDALISALEQKITTLKQSA